MKRQDGQRPTIRLSLRDSKRPSVTKVDLSKKKQNDKQNGEKSQMHRDIQIRHRKSQQIQLDLDKEDIRPIIRVNSTQKISTLLSPLSSAQASPQKPRLKYPGPTVYKIAQQEYLRQILSEKGNGWAQKIDEEKKHLLTSIQRLHLLDIEAKIKTDRAEQVLKKLKQS